jgi:hypothetical protein
MPKLVQELKIEHLEYLRELIINTFSKPIVNINDCKLLEETIQKAIKQRLSADTIARLFGIKKSNSSPSLFTLNTFSVYVGFTCWEDLIKNYLSQIKLYQRGLLFELITTNLPFEELSIRINSLPKTHETYDLFSQIILVKAKQNDEAFFENIFDFENIFGYQETFKYAIYNVIHLLGSLCDSNKWIEEIAVKKYYNLPYVEDYFIEWLVVPENHYYLKILENYYLTNIKNTDKVLFYHLIHCGVLANKNLWEDFQSHYNKINSLKLKTDKINNLLKMRWYGVQLLYNTYNKSSIKGICQKIYNSKPIKSEDSGNRISSIFIITCYLHRVKAYDFIIKLIEDKSRKHSKILGYWAELNYNQLKVFYAFALYKANRSEEAKIVFKQIHSDRFDLNFKNNIIPIYELLKTRLKQQ